LSKETENPGNPSTILKFSGEQCEHWQFQKLSVNLKAFSKFKTFNIKGHSHQILGYILSSEK
jgi:hypothetical protein